MVRLTRHIVAIPACDEAGYIGACLEALAGQAQRVVLLVNNSVDGTEHVAAREAVRLGLDLTISVQRFQGVDGSAGHARKTVMDLAAGMDRDAVLLTTDADSRVSPDWIAANLRHLAGGVDAVAGRAVIDPADAAMIPDRLHEDDARECALDVMLDEIASWLDPDAADPWPRHTEHSGASICVTAAAFARAGGIPDVPMGEDRGFFAALRRVDGVIRHASDVTVTVSGRIVGRAQGGMADTIRRRLDAPDPWLDDAIEPVPVAVRRARLRARARAVWREPDGGAALELAGDLQLPATALRLLLNAPYFGRAWCDLEARCTPLARQRVRADQVEAETVLAQRTLDTLRVSRGLRTNPSDRFQHADVQRV